MTLNSEQLNEIELRNNAASMYEENLLKFRSKWWIKAQFEIIIKKMKIKDGMSIYDAGCGVGLFSLKIAEKFNEAKITAVDFSDESIKILNNNLFEKKIKNVRTIIENIVDFIPGKFQFDRALCLDVLHYIPGENNRLKAVRNIYNSLKKNGLFITYNYRWGGFRKPPASKEEFGTELYRYAFTKEELTKLLLHAGFKKVSCTGIIRTPKKFRRNYLASISPLTETILMKLHLFENKSEYLLGIGIK